MELKATSAYKLTVNRDEADAFIHGDGFGLGGVLVDVYLKDDADKAIAELKQEADLYRSKFYEKDKAVTLVENRERHQKYKRCLAMAKRCFTKSNYHFVLARHGEDTKENNRRSILYSKWQNRWLELAGRFGG